MLKLDTHLIYTSSTSSSSASLSCACVRACVRVCVRARARVRAYACFLLLLLLLDCEEDGTIISVYIMCCLAILSLHGSWNTDVISLFHVCFSYIYPLST